MKILPAILLLGFCLFAAQTVAADQIVGQIVPGIYRLESNPPQKTMPPSPGVVYTEHFEHAIPQAAKVRYAVVARGPDKENFRLIFLADRNYRYDNTRADSANNLRSIAYASDNMSDSVFRHTDQITGPVFQWTRKAGPRSYLDNGTVAQWTKASFTIRWPDQKKLIRTETVPPEHKPTDEETGMCALGVCKPEAYGSVIQHFDVTHFADRFVLEVPRDYRDILPLAKTVPFYARADRASPQGKVEADSFVALLSESAEWAEVERFTPDSQHLHGWINRDDLEDVRWIEQKATTKAFRFRAAYPVATDKKWHDQDQDGAVAIEVLDRATGKRVQIIRDFYSSPMDGPSDEALRVIDANFDGQPDLVIAGHDGGAGPNSADNFFLFDPSSRTFRFEQELSDLTQTNVDPKNRTITSAERASCCDHLSTTWRYIGGKLTQVATWEEAITADGNWVETTNCRLVHGKMRCRITRERVNVEP